MAVMRSLYHAVPESIAVTEDPEAAGENEQNGAQVAGAPSEINQNKEENPTMEPKDMTLDQLRAENPALFEQIAQSAVAAERERIEEIDALTLPGYEDLAAKAKADGTSALDFQKALVAAMKQKGKDFITNRSEETKPGQSVAGGAPANGKTEEQEIQENAKEIAAYAAAYGADTRGGMY